MSSEIESGKQPPAKYFLAPDDQEVEEGFRPIRFEQPENRSSAIWRYMTIGKFLSLLQESKLFFCRLDKFGDPYEGTPLEFHQKWRRRVTELREQMERPPLLEIGESRISEHDRELLAYEGL